MSPPTSGLPSIGGCGPPPSEGQPCFSQSSYRFPIPLRSKVTLTFMEIRGTPFTSDRVIRQTAGSSPPFFTYFSSSIAAKVQDRLAGGFVPWSSPGSHSLARRSFSFGGGRLIPRPSFKDSRDVQAGAHVLVLQERLFARLHWIGFLGYPFSPSFPWERSGLVYANTLGSPRAPLRMLFAGLSLLEGQRLWR